MIQEAQLYDPETNPQEGRVYSPLGLSPNLRERPKMVMTAHTKANIKQRTQSRESTWTLDSTGSKMAISYPPIANTVTDGYPSDTRHHSHPMNQYRIRRLTPTECERLQGFPDGWTAQGTDGPIVDTQRYKLMGNAVTVNVIQAIGARILEVNQPSV